MAAKGQGAARHSPGAREAAGNPRGLRARRQGAGPGDWEASGEAGGQLGPPRGPHAPPPPTAVARHSGLEAQDPERGRRRNTPDSRPVLPPGTCTHRGEAGVTRRRLPAPPPEGRAQAARGDDATRALRGGDVTEQWRLPRRRPWSPGRRPLRGGARLAGDRGGGRQGPESGRQRTRPTPKSCFVASRRPSECGVESSREWAPSEPQSPHL